MKAARSEARKATASAIDLALRDRERHVVDRVDARIMSHAHGHLISVRPGSSPASSVLLR